MDDSGIVHHCAEQRIPGLSSDKDHASIRPNKPTITRQCIQGSLINSDMQQAVCGHPHRHGAAGCQRNRSQLGSDRPVIANFVAEQYNVPTIFCTDGSKVADFALARSVKSILARHEVRVGEV